MAVDHRFALSAEVHEPKHITNSNTADSGKVITPSSSTAGTSELRYLSLSDLSDGSSAVSLGALLDNDIINYQGWEMIEDGLVTTPSIVVGTSDTKLTVDDEGQANNTNASYLPRVIRGTGNLWNRSTHRINPIAVGDTYDLRVNLTISAAAGTPAVLTCLLDTGSTTSPTIVVAEDFRSINKTAPFTMTFDFPVFCLNNFFTNGGQIFLKTDAGSVTVEDRSILLVRTGSGNN